MKLLTTLAWASTAAAVVRIDLKRNAPETRQPPLLGRRQPPAEELANNITGGGYYAEIEVGTPGQLLTMVLDTGSSDAWIVAATADLCKSPQMQSEYGDSCGQTYHPGVSSTYELVAEGNFSIRYLDGSEAGGSYIKDDFSIGGATVQALQMGLATRTVRGTGILGVGYADNVAASQPYPNIVDEMVNQGLTQTRAFSLWLNDRRSSAGSILFGGIDTDKFMGDLRILPMVAAVGTGAPRSYQIAMTSLAVALSNGSTTAAAEPDGVTVIAVLDSGTTLSYLPDSMARQLFAAIGAYTDHQETGLTFVDCRLLTEYPDMTFDFGFGGGDDDEDEFTLRVPVYEMVLDVLAAYTGNLPSSIPFRHICLLGAQSSASFANEREPRSAAESEGECGDDLSSTSRRRGGNIDFSNIILGGGFGSLSPSRLALLGDTFLRSAYVVYDQTHGQIGLAPANLNSTASSVFELRADDQGLPRVSGVAGTPGSSSSSSACGGAGGRGGGDSGNAEDAGRSSGRGKGMGVENVVLMAAAGACAMLWTSFAA